MLPKNIPFVFLSILLALNGAAKGASITGRPFRGERTVPPDLMQMHNVDSYSWMEEYDAAEHTRHVRAAVKANGPRGEDPPVTEMNEADLATFLRSRRKSPPLGSKKDESLKSQNESEETDQDEVDYYYYYFDSFEEGVTGSIDFDDIKGNIRPEDSENDDDDSASVMELLTMASWHKSQKTDTNSEKA